VGLSIFDFLGDDFSVPGALRAMFLWDSIIHLYYHRICLRRCDVMIRYHSLQRPAKLLPSLTWRIHMPSDKPFSWSESSKMLYDFFISYVSFCLVDAQ